MPVWPRKSPWSKKLSSKKPSRCLKGANRISNSTFRCSTEKRTHPMLRIKGGKVYDPAHNINGVVKDICIADGRIVADVQGGKTIDAAGRIVFPGGVDIHTHVAGAALNFARAM